MDYSHHILAAIRDATLFDGGASASAFDQFDKAVAKEIDREISSAQKFDVSCLATTFNNGLLKTALDALSSDMLSTPFEKVLFSFGNADAIDEDGTPFYGVGTTLCVFGEIAPGVITVRPFWKIRGAKANHWRSLPSTISFLSSGPSEEHRIIFNTSSALTKHARASLTRCAAFFLIALALIDARDVEIRNEIAPKKLNAAREKRGQLPLSDHRIVFIPQSIIKRMRAEQGTHESPRLHWRRGHIRTLPSGEKVKVRACLVGDASKGMVTHDYVVTGRRGGTK
jgi:hypothetical protein